MLYQIIIDKLTVDGKTVDSFGISCDGITVPHVTLDQGRLSTLVHHCNHLDLHLIHLNDVIEDFLAD